MFTWLNKTGVESSDGFVVQSVGRFEIEYREGDNLMSIEVEPGIKDNVPCVIVSNGAFRRWKHSDKVLSHDKQQQIMSNFIAALNFQNLEVVVDWD